MMKRRDPRGASFYPIRNQSPQGRRDRLESPGLILCFCLLCGLSSPRGLCRLLTEACLGCHLFSQGESTWIKYRASKNCSVCFQEKSKHGVENIESMSHKQDQGRAGGERMVISCLCLANYSMFCLCFQQVIFHSW